MPSFFSRRASVTGLSGGRRSEKTGRDFPADASATDVDWLAYLQSLVPTQEDSHAISAATTSEDAVDAVLDKLARAQARRVEQQLGASGEQPLATDGHLQWLLGLTGSLPALYGLQEGCAAARRKPLADALLRCAHHAAHLVSARAPAATSPREMRLLQHVPHAPIDDPLVKTVTRSFWLTAASQPSTAAAAAAVSDGGASLSACAAEKLLLGDDSATCAVATADPVLTTAFASQAADSRRNAASGAATEVELASTVALAESVAHLDRVLRAPPPSSPPEPPAITLEGPSDSPHDAQQRERPQETVPCSPKTGSRTSSLPPRASGAEARDVGVDDSPRQGASARGATTATTSAIAAHAALRPLRQLLGGMLMSEDARCIFRDEPHGFLRGTTLAVHIVDEYAQRTVFDRLKAPLLQIVQGVAGWPTLPEEDDALQGLPRNPTGPVYSQAALVDAVIDSVHELCDAIAYGAVGDSVHHAEGSETGAEGQHVWPASLRLALGDLAAFLSVAHFHVEQGSSSGADVRALWAQTAPRESGPPSATVFGTMRGAKRHRRLEVAAKVFDERLASILVLHVVSPLLLSAWAMESAMAAGRSASAMGTRRRLVLFTKIIQKAANGSTFGAALSAAAAPSGLPPTTSDTFALAAIFDVQLEQMLIPAVRAALVRVPLYWNDVVAPPLMGFRSTDNGSTDHHSISEHSIKKGPSGSSGAAFAQILSLVYAVHATAAAPPPAPSPPQVLTMAAGVAPLAPLPVSSGARQQASLMTVSTPATPARFATLLHYAANAWLVPGADATTLSDETVAIASLRRDVLQLVGPDFNTATTAVHGLLPQFPFHEERLRSVVGLWQLAAADDVIAMPKHNVTTTLVTNAARGIAACGRFRAFLLHPLRAPSAPLPAVLVQAVRFQPPCVVLVHGALLRWAHTCGMREGACADAEALEAVIVAHVIARLRLIAEPLQLAVRSETETNSGFATLVTAKQATRALQLVFVPPRVASAKDVGHFDAEWFQRCVVRALAGTFFTQRIFRPRLAVLQLPLRPDVALLPALSHMLEVPEAQPAAVAAAPRPRASTVAMVSGALSSLLSGVRAAAAAPAAPASNTGDGSIAVCHSIVDLRTLLNPPAAPGVGAASAAAPSVWLDLPPDVAIDGASLASLPRVGPTLSGGGAAQGRIGLSPATSAQAAAAQSHRGGASIAPIKAPPTNPGAAMVRTVRGAFAVLWAVQASAYRLTAMVLRERLQPLDASAGGGGAAGDANSRSSSRGHPLAFTNTRSASSARAAVVDGDLVALGPGASIGTDTCGEASAMQLLPQFRAAPSCESGEGPRSPAPPLAVPAPIRRGVAHLADAAHTAACDAARRAGFGRLVGGADAVAADARARTDLARLLRDEWCCTAGRTGVHLEYFSAARACCGPVEHPTPPPPAAVAPTGSAHNVTPAASAAAGGAPAAYGFISADTLPQQRAAILAASVAGNTRTGRPDAASTAAAVEAAAAEAPIRAVSCAPAAIAGPLLREVIMEHFFATPYGCFHRRALEDLCRVYFSEMSEAGAGHESDSSTPATPTGRSALRLRTPCARRVLLPDAQAVPTTPPPPTSDAHAAAPPAAWTVEDQPTAVRARALFAISSLFDGDCPVSVAAESGPPPPSTQFGAPGGALRVGLLVRLALTPPATNAVAVVGAAALVAAAAAAPDKTPSAGAIEEPRALPRVRFNERRSTSSGASSTDAPFRGAPWLWLTPAQRHVLLSLTGELQYEPDALALVRELLFDSARDTAARVAFDVLLPWLQLAVPRHCGRRLSESALRDAATEFLTAVSAGVLAVLLEYAACGPAADVPWLALSAALPRLATSSATRKDPTQDVTL